MKGELIVDENHISRICPRKTLDPDTQIVTGASFRLRLDENYLSVNWLESLESNNNREIQISKLKIILDIKGYTLKKSSKIAVLHVGNMCSHVKENSKDQRCLEVFHEPNTIDCSHSGIYNSKVDEILISELIAQKVEETY